MDLGSKQGIQDICAEQGGGDASSCEAHIVEILFLQNPIQLTFALVVQWLPNVLPIRCDEQVLISFSKATNSGQTCTVVAKK